MTGLSARRPRFALVVALTAVAPGETVSISSRKDARGDSLCQNLDVNLVLLQASELDNAGDVTLTGTRAAHLLNVLKVAPGRSLRIGLLDGPCGTGTVTTTSDRALTMRCVFETEPPPRPAVDLLIALPRPKVMRRLWAQLAALGVGRIILTNAERVERHYFDSHVLSPAAYRPLLIEGLQQARDTRLPLVSIHRQFKILIEDHLDGLFAEGTRVVTDPSASTARRGTVGPSRGRGCCWRSGPKAAGTSSSARCCVGTGSRRSEWAAARFAPIPHALPC